MERTFLPAVMYDCHSSAGQPFMSHVQCASRNSFFMIVCDSYSSLQNLYGSTNSPKAYLICRIRLTELSTSSILILPASISLSCIYYRAICHIHVDAGIESQTGSVFIVFRHSLRHQLLHCFPIAYHKTIEIPLPSQ